VYSGRPGYGGQLPYALGERSSAAYNLAGVGPSGHGPYLGDFFDELTKIAHKVGVISGEVGKVARGDATVATIPKGQATITIPMGGGLSQAVPLWVLGVGAAGLAYFAFSGKRR
jgi:hypothetical protein